MSKLLTAISVFVLISCAVNAQDAKSVLDHAAKTIGAANLKSITYSGSAHNRFEQI